MGSVPDGLYEIGRLKQLDILEQPVPKIENSESNHRSGTTAGRPTRCRAGSPAAPSALLVDALFLLPKKLLRPFGERLRLVDRLTKRRLSFFNLPDLPIGFAGHLFPTPCGLNRSASAWFRLSDHSQFV